ncbi:hypothetical protein Snoj_34550 [Streptomyces nojiriensis]|uniref:Uncharacterized protein n=1 Tax=Streptomyces nojiriensis TaxID=66374 RepID=A0ABQ3SN23_9ACTN|nr:hypothetical protein GCM10010205_71460 [Streptomyces nojiriensis]GHI69537.1 hypothetical protein Snoj_34550 [Streptomyces nojiriensis]
MPKPRNRSHIGPARQGIPSSEHPLAIAAQLRACPELTVQSGLLEFVAFVAFEDRLTLHSPIGATHIICTSRGPAWARQTRRHGVRPAPVPSEMADRAVGRSSG